MNLHKIPRDFPSVTTVQILYFLSHENSKLIQIIQRSPTTERQPPSLRREISCRRGTSASPISYPPNEHLQLTNLRDAPLRLAMAHCTHTIDVYPGFPVFDIRNAYESWPEGMTWDVIIRCQWRVPRKESRTLRVRRIIKPDNRTGWGGFAALPSPGVEIHLPCIVIKRRSACGLRGAFKKCHNYTVTAVRCQWSPRTDISLLLLLFLLVCPSYVRQCCFLLLYSSCFCSFHRHSDVIARLDTVTPGPAIELLT